MSRVYGIGAAIVIIGAMFKILHLPGADWAIGIGLTTEAMIFFVSAFEPVKEEIDWTLVYPELAGMDSGGKGKDKDKNLTKSIDKMLEEARIEQTTINRLGEGLRSLTESVNDMGQLTNAATATNEYADKVKTASASVDRINQAYVNAIDAVDRMGQGSDVTVQYYQELNRITQQLGQINTIYEQELRESDQLGKQLRNWVNTLGQATENLMENEGATRQLGAEFTKLNSNLGTLNSIYGNMLSAMNVGARG